MNAGKDLTGRRVLLQECGDLIEFGGREPEIGGADDAIHLLG